jgi:hypothetical protein
MWHFVVLVLGALMLSGCGSPFSSAEQTSLAAARARWAARPFADYAFETEHACFCDPAELGPFRIEVQAGTISAVTRLTDGTTLAPTAFGRLYTIEQFFARIPTFAASDWVEDVEVSYAALGYPETIAVRAKRDVTDAGETYTLRAVAALAP